MKSLQVSNNWLEPSAGLGALASLMPEDRRTCVEISKLHCTALEAKGIRAINADFMEWGPSTKFDRIVMNPPFSEGRWKAHLERAIDMLAPGGVVVAILPESARRGIELGEGAEWSEPYPGEFEGTSVTVVMLRYSK